MTLQVMQHAGFFKSLGFAHLRILSFSDSVLIDDVKQDFVFAEGKKWPHNSSAPVKKIRSKKQLSALNRR